MVFIPPKSAQVNFLWGKNDVRTAIQQFYTPNKLLYPQNKFLATPLVIFLHVLTYLKYGPRNAGVGKSSTGILAGVKAGRGPRNAKK